jgi:hypothetical protein
MVGECLKCFVAFTLLGLAAAKLSDNMLNSTTLHKAFSRSQTVNLQPFQWDPNFCDDYDDLEAFPHPGNAKNKMI